jgi:hypothetical protein
MPLAKGLSEEPQSSCCAAQATTNTTLNISLLKKGANWTHPMFAPLACKFACMLHMPRPLALLCSQQCYHLTKTWCCLPIRHV